jgi:hypothetical protein
MERLEIGDHSLNILVQQAKRRSFSAEYKPRILEEVDTCGEPSLAR